MSETQNHDAPPVVRRAFDELFGRGRTGEMLERKAHWACDVQPGVQWNADFDPDDASITRVKFGINIESKSALRSIFSENSSGLRRDLTAAFQGLPESVICRVYRHDRRAHRISTIFEADAPSMISGGLGQMIAAVRDLLEDTTRPGFPSGYPKPHVHIFREVWREGTALQPDVIIAEMASTHRLLGPVMAALSSRSVAPRRRKVEP